MRFIRLILFYIIITNHCIVRCYNLKSTNFVLVIVTPCSNSKGFFLFSLLSNLPAVDYI
jgi:hypothetical protein